MATFPIKRTPNQRSYATVSVTSAADGLSDIIDMGGLAPKGVEFSTAWTAAGCSFLVGRTSALMASLQSSTDGALVRVSSGAINTGARTMIGLNSQQQDELSGFRYIQFFSNTTAGVAVVQGSTRICYLFLGVPEGPIK